MAASGAKAAFATRNSDKVMRKVQEAEASGLLHQDDAKSVVSKLVGVMNGEAAASDKPLVEDETVKGALDTVVTSAGKKKISVTTDSATGSQAVTTESETPAPTTPAHDLVLDGIVPLRQPSPETCWAAALTILVSWQRRQSLPIETVLAEGGQSYVDMFHAGQALKFRDLAQFRSDFGLRDISLGALSADTIAAGLKDHGALWVVADEDASENTLVHARVLYGIRGDGAPTTTHVFYVDPATGKGEDETLAAFVEKMTQLSGAVQSVFGGVSPLVLGY
jgi:hypothetical protein